MVIKVNFLSELCQQLSVLDTQPETDTETISKYELIESRHCVPYICWTLLRQFAVNSNRHL